VAGCRIYGYAKEEQAMNISLSELKANLLRYLHLAQQGEELVITHHGRPIARIVPVETPAEISKAEAIRNFRRLPWVRTGDPTIPIGSANPLPHTPGQKTVSEIVIEDRG
jgi:prevent-host-death family protein